jgi:hypothetical protein
MQIKSNQQHVSVSADQTASRQEGRLGSKLPTVIQTPVSFCFLLNKYAIVFISGSSKGMRLDFLYQQHA